MKLLFLSISFCCGAIFSNAQLSLSDTISEQRSFSSTTTRDGKLSGYYPSGNKQYEGYRRKETMQGAWSSWYDNGRLLDNGSMQKGIPDGQWSGWYENGNPRFIRTYSAVKWQQFQNEKTRYHPKRVTMPLTELYHNNKGQAEKYTKADHTFCAIKNCTRINEDLQQAIDNNTSGQHYHPVFETGLLHGVFANYFPDGAVKDSGNYKNGLPEGMWIKWTDDRKFYWEGHYRHGLKNKEWKLYASNAKLISIVSFHEGKFFWRKDMKDGVAIAEEELTGF